MRRLCGDSCSHSQCRPVTFLRFSLAFFGLVLAAIAPVDTWCNSRRIQVFLFTTPLLCCLSAREAAILWPTSSKLLPLALLLATACFRSGSGLRWRWAVVTAICLSGSFPGCGWQSLGVGEALAHRSALPPGRCHHRSQRWSPSRPRCRPRE